MKESLTRRDFLKYCGIGTAGVAVAAALAGCSSSSSDDSSSTTTTTSEGTSSSSDSDSTPVTTEPEEVEDVPEEDEFVVYDVGNDEDIYMAALGDFYDRYEAVKEDSSLSVSERYAGMGVAEAFLVESGVASCYSTNGGGYNMGKYAYRTGNYSQWGNDNNKKWRRLITNETITTEDYEYLRTLWTELRGTGTYRQKAEEYLAGKNYTFSDTYQNTFSDTPTTWDILGTSKSANSGSILDTICGLLEYDGEGIQQPALATSYEISDDKLTYTFHLREGAIWVDSQGRKVADCIADDWVAGMQHMIDTQGGLEWLVEGVIKGASEYIYGDTTDFTTVGVSAPDDYTLVYTLEQPTSYFLTMLGYGAFMPMSRAYYTSQGGQFGMDTYNSSSNYTYATDKDHIAYNGAFLCTNVTDKNSMNYVTNESYWDAEHVVIKNWNSLYNDNTDQTKSYTDYANGLLTEVGLSGARLELAKNDGNFDQYAWVNYAEATSFMGWMNMNRQAYANVNDGACASPQTEEQREVTHAAMSSKHFRLALAHAFDRPTYNAISVGDDLKNITLRNSYTPATFVVTDEEVTVDINGTPTTFPAGTYYGEFMQAQLDADGCPIKVWDDDLVTGDGFEGIYNLDNAAKEFELALEDLASVGIEVTADNPIYVDRPTPTYNETSLNQANAYKNMIEDAFGGLVKVNLVEASSTTEYNWTGYNCDYGYECNYDMLFNSGWGPDYGDPSTYLDTMMPYGDGYMCMLLGLW